MKKILSVVALIAVSASLVACGGKKEEAATQAPAVVEEPAPATAAAPATTEAAPATTEAAPATTEAAPATTAAPAAPAAAPAK